MEWINTGRVSDNWKALLFEHKPTKRQIGIYNRDTKILVRLENYDAMITGIIKQDKNPTSHALEKANSKFKGGKGVCVTTDTVENFKTLLKWYFA